MVNQERLFLEELKEIKKTTTEIAATIHEMLQVIKDTCTLQQQLADWYKEFVATKENIINITNANYEDIAALATNISESIKEHFDELSTKMKGGNL